MTLRRFSPLAPAAAIFLACTASEPERLAPPAAQDVTVTVSPPEATVEAGGEVAFEAAVTGTVNTAVTWAVAPAGCGAVSATGGFTAPAAAANCQVVATSAADPNVRGAATVTVTAPPPPSPPPAVSVSISPGSAPVDACRSVTFTASVTNATNTAVTWSVQEGAAGGTVTAAGVYTAPETAGTYHVVATSVASGTATAIAEVTVTERVLSVVVTPAQITVPAGGSTQFTATVTTTCGSVASQKTLSATADGVVTGG